MTTFSTPLSERLGLAYPLVAAPMFLVSGRELIVAAAEAGILGCMPALNARTAEQLDEDLGWIRARTDKAFGINVTIGLTAPARLAQDVELIVRHQVPVVITSYGDPTAVVEAVRGYDSTVFHDVINLRHARKAVAAGVDAIIAVSAGAGGHAGTVSPYALIPWLREELPVPIVAAGCISTGKQVAASLALGAELCYCGTRFIVAEESRAPDAYRRLVTETGPADIVYTDAVSGTHANFLKQTLPDSDAPIRSADSSAWKDVWSAGQGVAEIRRVQPAREIVDDLVREYHEAKAALP